MGLRVKEPTLVAVLVVAAGRGTLSFRNALAACSLLRSHDGFDLVIDGSLVVQGSSLLRCGVIGTFKGKCKSKKSMTKSSKFIGMQS